MTAHASQLSMAAPLPAQVRMRRRELLFLPRGHLGRIAYWSVLGAVAMLPLYYGTSLWLLPGLAVTIFVSWHALALGARVPWIPGIMTVAACVQWLVTPWLSYVMDAGGATPSMAAEPSVYFRYAVPSSIMYALGLYLPTLLSARLPRTYDFRIVRAPRRLAAICDAMILIGTVARVVAVPLAPASLRFAAATVGYLSLVGALGIALLRPRRWYLRIAFAMAPVVLYNLRDTQFLEVLTWAVLVGTFSAYGLRLRPLHLATLAIGAALLLLAVNAGKRDYRLEMYQGVADPGSVAVGVGGTVADYLTQPGELLSWKTVSYTILRLNEGWITSRLLVWTPTMEPYARGETVATALHAALVPRIFDADKPSAGGHDNTPRFTGLLLINGTSMNLSIPGEMYANWGMIGAILGTFVVALLLGWIYLAFAIRAKRSILWFAWASYVMIGAVSPEVGLLEMLNSVTKSLLVMFILIRVIPTWRRAMWPPRPRRTAPARAVA